MEFPKQKSFHGQIIHVKPCVLRCTCVKNKTYMKFQKQLHLLAGAPLSASYPPEVTLLPPSHRVMLISAFCLR